MRRGEEATRGPFERVEVMLGVLPLDRASQDGLLWTIQSNQAHATGPQLR